MRDRAVQPDVVTDREPSLVAPGHDDQPAAGPDLDRDIVREAIFFDGFQEDSLADQNHEIIFPLLLTSQQLIARSALISASILRASPRVNDVVVEPPREIERLPF
ncbi:hypothetical protein [uncultured Bradyrhizobium sp.]|uniref:hypothetical protein n=1 Tax=uncultured Bradyrhizobium sp. TaxID=199684 RepID=UPI002616CD67|nr:hypothetical protein [uncultured Bradyrhizobium sp.]